MLLTLQPRLQASIHRRGSQSRNSPSTLTARLASLKSRRRLDSRQRSTIGQQRQTMRGDRATVMAATMLRRMLLLRHDGDISSAQWTVTMAAWVPIVSMPWGIPSPNGAMHALSGWGMLHPAWGMACSSSPWGMAKVVTAAGNIQHGAWPRQWAAATFERRACQRPHRCGMDFAHPWLLQHLLQSSPPHPSHHCCRTRKLHFFKQ